MTATVTAMALEGVQTITRDLRHSDRGFIASRWGLDYRPRIPYVTRAVFDEYHPRLIDKLLEVSRVVVLCSERSPNTIFGFAVGQPGLLHWVHVVTELRGRGIGRTLMAAATGTKPDEPFQCSHRFQRPMPRAVFNPFSIAVIG